MTAESVAAAFATAQDRAERLQPKGAAFAAGMLFHLLGKLAECEEFGRAVDEYIDQSEAASRRWAEELRKAAPCRVCRAAAPGHTMTCPLAPRHDLAEVAS